MGSADTIRRETPPTAEDAAALLRASANDGTAVRIAGAATKVWGHPGADCGVLLATIFGFVERRVLRWYHGIKEVERA